MQVLIKMSGGRKSNASERSECALSTQVPLSPSPVMLSHRDSSLGDNPAGPATNTPESGDVTTPGGACPRDPRVDGNPWDTNSPS